MDFTRQIKVPALGIIENMSDFPCPHCGKEIKIFGKGGGETAARELGVPFLGRIPLDPRFVITGDTGKPFIDEYPDSDTARALNDILATIITESGQQ